MKNLFVPGLCLMLAASVCSTRPCAADEWNLGPAQTAPQTSGSLNYLKFDTTGWEGSGTKERMVYDNEKIGSMSVRLIPTPPKTAPEVEGIRKAFRAMAQSSGGGLISADVIKIKGIPCIRTIVKMRLQDNFMYGGTLIFLFADSQIMVTVQSKEKGVSGRRGTEIFDKLTRTGEIKFDEDDEDQSPLNWTADPYDPTIKGKGLRNLSEDEKYDSEFPDDPLSLVRATMAKVESTVSISPRAVPYRFEEGLRATPAKGGF